jgi:hypothetical protein
VISLTIVCVGLIVALVLEKRQNTLREKEWALERATLLQRIQAPEVAVADHLDAVDQDLAYVHFDADEAED